MTIMVADEGLLGLTELIPSHCEIRWYSGRDIPQSMLKGADALLVRSTARVSAHNLPTRFVWLEQRPSAPITFRFSTY